VQIAAETVIQTQIRRVALPRRYSLPMREIWEMQQRLTAITGKRPLRLLTHPRFRAGYDFLLLRADADEEAAELADWWTRFLALDDMPAASRRRNLPSSQENQIPPPSQIPLRQQGRSSRSADAQSLNSGTADAYYSRTSLYRHRQQSG
jgi:poly(A) polymerase